MNAADLKQEIETCLKFRREYKDHEGKHPFAVDEVVFRVDGNNLIFELWGGNLVFYDFKPHGAGSWYFDDTSGG